MGHTIIFILYFLLPRLLTSPSETLEKVSFSVTNRTLHNKQSFTVKGDLFYHLLQGRLITHYKYPNENYVFTNAKGEMRIYNPSKNEVMIKLDQTYSSEGNFITFFFNGKTKDMGLTNMGFIAGKIRFENGFEIKEYSSPQYSDKKMVKAELVFKNFSPVYLSFYNADRKKIKKTFFADYTYFNTLPFPMKITEITYVSEKDSVISQQLFSDLKYNSSVDDKIFQYQIPSNAKLIQ